MSDATGAPTISGASPSAGHPQCVELTVGGMTCPHCPPAIEKALAAIPPAAPIAFSTDKPARAQALTKKIQETVAVVK